MNILGWFLLGLTGWISLLSKGLRSLLHHNSKASILRQSSFFMVQLSHPYMTTGKTTALTKWILVGKLMSLLFHMLPSFVIAFLPRSKCLLISWLQALSSVVLEPKKIKSVIAPPFPPPICHEVVRLDIMILVFWMLSFKSAFSLFSFTLSKSSLVPLHILPLEWYLHIWGCCYFSQQSWFLLNDLSSLAFHMRYSAYKLNKQGDNIQPCHTPFQVLNESVVPCKVLTCFLTHKQVSQEAGKMVWYSHLFKNFPVCYDLHSQRLWCSQ